MPLTLNVANAVHSARHGSAGADPITPAAIGAATPADVALKTTPAAAAAAAAALILAEHDAALAAANSKYAPHTPVTFVVDDQMPGLVICGFDKPTGTVYAYADDSVTTLYTVAGVDRKITPIWQFTAGMVIRHVWVTAAGSVLVMVTNVGGATTTIWRSAAGGAFTAALANYGNSTTGALQNQIAQTTDGTLYYGEYNTAPGAATVYLRKSVDDGATWTVVQTFVNEGAHMHATMSDPFVPNRVWRCWGDTDPKSKVEYSDNGGTVWTVIGSGDQTWRTVSLLFTADEVFMAGDTSDVNPPIRAWNRTTLVRRTLLDDMENQAFYSVQTPEGLFAWTVATSNGLTTPDIAGLWVGDLAVGAAKPTQAMRLRMTPDVTRINVYLYGPDADNTIWLTVYSLGATASSSMTYRAHLEGGQQLGAKNVELPNRTVNPPLLWATVGPDPGSLTTTYGLTVNREYLQAFVAPPIARSGFRCVTLRNGATVAGNISVGIRESVGSSSMPGPMLVASPATAQTGVGLDQKHTFDKHIQLVPGRLYWLSLVGDGGATALVVGSNNTSWKQGWGTFIVVGTATPAPVAAPVTVTGAWTFAALLSKY